jgi:nucleotide-binding universal stress UspA family protein
MDTARQELADVLREARALLARPGNDFAWSSWADAAAALAEVDRLIAALEADRLPPRLAVSVLFAPTGPIQEVSLSSGWADEFLALAGRCDAAVEAAYNASWWRRLLNRRVGRA